MPESFNPAHLARLVAGDSDDTARQSGVSLSVEIDDDLSPFEADQAAVRLMLDNLVANALQVSPQGGEVKLVVGRNGDGLVMTVSDQGPGMSADDLAVIDRPYGGIAEVEGPQGLIGFRLSVVDRLSELVGGRLEIEDGSDGGTKATLTL